MNYFPELRLKGVQGHFKEGMDIQRASLVAQMVRRLLAMWQTWVRLLGREDLLEKGMATHSSIFAPPQKIGAQRNIGEGIGNPLQYS